MAEGEIRLSDSSGGLVTEISSYLSATRTGNSHREHLWIGWPGDLPQSAEEHIAHQSSWQGYQVRSIFLNEEDIEYYYQGFCNKTIWPLFHYFHTHTVLNTDFWRSYKAINEAFCELVLEIATPNDVVWIHDYHLMLLPMLLRRKMPNANISFFLHIPFPEFETFRVLPYAWRYEILHGILGANLVGFYTSDYIRYFSEAVLRTLGYNHDSGQITVGKHKTAIAAVPIGIEFHNFHRSSIIGHVSEGETSIKVPKAGAIPRFILSIDRLDYTKGIAERLEAFERFLKNHPEWHEAVVLRLVVVPSREALPQYKTTRESIERTVERINRDLGTVTWEPIWFQSEWLPLPTLIELYKHCDVALITPLRDGLNRTALEYVAARTEGTGVLILSETAGAAELLDEALIVNPWYSDEVADAINSALNMPLEEQAKRLDAMQNRLQLYDVVSQTDYFIEKLLLSNSAYDTINTELPGDAPISESS
jgi:trehalose 6-phosphate synthase/phosphatase